MYKFRFRNIGNTNPYEELIKVFLTPEEYGICTGDEEADFEYSGERDRLKRELFRDLSKISGKTPGWGTLTGIRPVKLAAELADRNDSDMQAVREKLKDDYLLHATKADLVMEILDYQRNILGAPENNSISLYIGIPFCPTRCLYCSFTSSQASEEEIDRYLKALHREIQFCGERTGAAVIESLYYGGGTPTTLNALQLDKLLSATHKSFNLKCLRELTVEAGRPDTITEEKLRVLKDHGVNRISINPQSMKESTLEIIGRKHSADDVYNAFETAHKIGIETINTDLIAGLPEESEKDFADSLEKIIGLGADNITLHTLAVKRSSRLKEVDEKINYRNESLRNKMLVSAHEKLRNCSYRPYYLYRQKNTSGDTENTGFCRKDKVSVYNIRIMEERQSILAFGAGGISKIYFPEENRLERIANVSNYNIYIERIEEMLTRKEKSFFIQEEPDVNKCT